MNTETLFAEPDNKYPIILTETQPPIIPPTIGTGEDTEHNELLYKILVVGDISVGKTSMIKRYVHKIFAYNSKPTIGVDFALKCIRWDKNTNVRLQLWDISGQERFGTMTRVYYREAVGAFVVFDVTRHNTFESVKKWKLDLDAKVYLPNTNANLPIILLANKIDLLNGEDSENEYCEDIKDDMDEYCKKYGFLTWFEISAKDNVNIDAATNRLIEEILKLNINNYDNDNSVMLNKKIVVNKDQGCC